LIDLTHRISRWLAWLAGAIILFGSAVPIAIDVIARQIIGRTLVESFEMSEYALAACIGLGLGYTVTTRAHVRVDILTARLPRNLRLIFDLIASVTLAVTAVAMAWYALSVIQETWRLDARSISTLRVPLILPQSIWWAGFFWFATVACLIPVFAMARLLHRDPAGAEKLISNPQLTEEMEEIGIDVGDTTMGRDA
jgi:TRAP-type C4-dicarboxylate transport system permease small subunit